MRACVSSRLRALTGPRSIGRTRTRRFATVAPARISASSKSGESTRLMNGRPGLANCIGECVPGVERASPGAPCIVNGERERGGAQSLLFLGPRLASQHSDRWDGRPDAPPTRAPVPHRQRGVFSRETRPGSGAGTRVSRSRPGPFAGRLRARTVARSFCY